MNKQSVSADRPPPAQKLPPAMHDMGPHSPESKWCDQDFFSACAHLEPCDHHAQLVAETTDHTRDLFLAMLSHELRAPLAPIMMAVSMLQKKTQDNPELQNLLELVRRNVGLEARLIDDLLDLTKIVQGKLILDRRCGDLCTAIQRAVEVCRPNLEAKQLDLKIDFGPQAPYMVESDLVRLQQVFWNLLNNSIKFTSPGGTVSITCRPEKSSHVIVEVSDNGIGIEPGALPCIFETFAQADRAVTRQFGGLGIGLAISRSFVEMHGGTIEALSQGKGKGATFRICLPLMHDESELALIEDAPVTTSHEKVQMAPIRILVVEDHRDTADMLRILLEADGHYIRVASSAAGAIELAGQEIFDLVISDLGLPDKNGLELMRQLHKEFGLKGIAVTGYGTQADLAQTQNAGFSAHLVKPIDLDQLEATIPRVINP